ncbi:class I SAM-dependent methyltransferase [Campylobacter sp. RM16704]|uniref:class I SAM-dependent methyltransferase n=1 Tax=Campylobacter sp. RM16704 TaxID=1500960 RepID=UPI00057E1D08|nr:class I SAM-dependent methyltransferase [Campylobacter sp. RM16704]AJC86777.1 SAM-dependent methyltransferase [Campylobacter sp. RM16704]
MNKKDIWENIYKERSRCILYPSENFVGFFYRTFIKEKKENISILELGCGWGNNLNFLRQEGYNPTGIDFSQEAVDYLKKQNYDVHCNNISQIDVNKYQSKFDLIYACGVLECNNIPDIEKTLLFCYKALKENGKIYILSTNNDFYDKDLVPTPITKELFLSIIKKYDINFKNIQIDYLTKTLYNQEKTIKLIEITCSK